MFRLSLLFPILLAALACAQTPSTSPSLSAQTATPLPPTSAQPAIDGVFAAFKTHPIVAIDDAHGLAQQLDFYGALVRDPRFGREVGNVVVEFGGSVRQDVINRYVAGENVPYAELRRVWTDTVGWIPVVPYIGQLNFFAHVRSANLRLPPDQRIRVWLGEPPIDWTKITTRVEFIPLLRQRDDFPGALINREIIAKNRKALVIYGGNHLLAYPPDNPNAKPHAGTEAALRQIYADLALDRPTFSLLTPGVFASLERLVGLELSGIRGMIDVIGPINSIVFRGADAEGSDVYFLTTSNSNLRATISLDANGKADRFSIGPLTVTNIVEAHRPGAVFHVTPFEGFAGKACTRNFEDQAKAWPTPALAPLRGTALERDLEAPGCGFLPSGVPASDTPREEPDDGTLTHDAMLYLGPARDLLISPGLPDMYLDADYRKEMLLRGRVMRGVPTNAEPAMETVTVTPSKWRPD